MMRSSNPVLAGSPWSSTGIVEQTTTGTMTVQGVVNKTALLLLLVIASAAWVWHLFYRAPTAGAGMTATVPWMIGGALGGFVLGLVTVFKQEWAGVTAPIYALCEGLFIGGLSAFMELRYPGIAVQAVALTFGTLAAMLGAYTTGIIKVNNTFRAAVVGATAAIALVYLASLLLGLFGVRIPFIHESGPIGIAFSVVVTAIAALNLALDFDFVAQGVAARAPRRMEWYGAFGLIVTLVWLYIEFLRLLAKLRSRN